MNTKYAQVRFPLELHVQMQLQDAFHDQNGFITFYEYTEYL